MSAGNPDAVQGRSLNIEGREFRVVSVTTREPAGMTPAFRLLEIRAQPALRVDLALPEEWNGRLYMNGNGGFAGEPVDSPLRDLSRAIALFQGYAVVGSNTGHDEAVDPLASFGTDREKLLDYAYRAVHQSVVVAKVLLPLIYGRGPAFTYFEGCSTGGRQGLMAAQRYPEDFDGIIAGCPVLDLTGSQLWGIRTGQWLADTGIGPRQMKIIASVVNKRFGAQEGRNPELIDDPLGADFDPLRDLPICEDGSQRDDCLTRQQAEAIARVYRETSLGRGRTFPGLPVGAEGTGAGQPGFAPLSGWEGWFYPSPDGFFAGAPHGVRVSFAESFLRGMLGYRGHWKDFDFSDQVLQGLDALSALIDAVDPDLSGFARAGGKLLLYHGLADAAVNPARTIAYFDSVRSRMGDTLDRFMRFYTAPGMFHCFGGYGPDRFDMLSSLVQWVEQDVAPDMILASQVPNPTKPQETLQRPLYPYPAIPRYDGHGDPNSVASYKAVMRVR